MDSVIALEAGVLVFTQWVDNSLQTVVVRDIGKKKSVRLDGYENFEPMAISPDGERIALFRGTHWEGQRNEVAVIAWRRRERLLFKNEQPYGTALFDATGTLLLVTIEKQKTVCIDVATGEVVAQTTGKHQTLRAYHFDATRNAVWLPPPSRRAKRQLFDFATRTERPAPAAVDAVSPGGALYRIDENVTRLDASFQPMWSVFASRPGIDFPLTAHPLFGGTEDVIVFDEPNPGSMWGFWVARNATTGKELARRDQASGEAPEVGWPGRYLVQPNEQLLWSVDTLATKPVDLLGPLRPPAPGAEAPPPVSRQAVPSVPTSSDMTFADATTATIVAGRCLACTLSPTDAEELCDAVDALAERLELPLVLLLAADFSTLPSQDEPNPYRGVVGLLCVTNDVETETLQAVTVEALHSAVDGARALPWAEIEALLPPLDEPLSVDVGLVATATGPLAGFELAFGVPAARTPADDEDHTQTDGESPQDRELSLAYVAGRNMAQETPSRGVWGTCVCDGGDWPLLSLGEHLGNVEQHRAEVGSLADEARYIILPRYD
jgi:hypothetical protein